MLEFIYSQRQCDADGRYGEDLRRDRFIFISIVASQTQSRVKVKSINKSGHVRVCVCVCVCARAVNKPTRATLLGAINKTLFYQTTCLPVSRSYITQPSTPFQHCVTSVSLFDLDLATQPPKLSLTLNQPNQLFFSFSNKLIRTCLAAEKVERYFNLLLYS